MQENDLDLLPNELKALSINEHEIVLPYEAAVQAIAYLRSQAIALLGWEGWMQYADGNIGHARAYQGTVSINQNVGESWSDYVDRSAEWCIATITSDYEHWQQHASHKQEKLFFCLTCLRSAEE